MAADETFSQDQQLLKKLDFEPGDTLFVETTPNWYSEMIDEAGVEITPDLPATHAHLFFNSKQDLIEFLREYNVKTIKKSLWFSWPKKASNAQLALNEQILQDAVAKLGWVSAESIEIDESWHGLKFTRRSK